MNRNRIAALLLTGALLPCFGQELTAAAVSMRLPDAPVVSEPSQKTVLPTSYDMRKAGLTTRVGQQGGYGMCWSFASLASLESTLIRQKPDIDLSEWSLAYYTYASEFGFSGDRDITTSQALQMGGNFYVTAPMMTGWLAPVAEADCPFGDMTALDPDMTAETLRSQAVWHVTDAEMILYDIDADITDAQRIAVKQSVYDGQAVAMSLYNLTSAYNAGARAFYNAGNQRRGGNYHAVTIVGWDDAFSADNFLTAPPADGAFLCKNSWGTMWGDAGYFWVSYYDPTIVELYTIRGESTNRHTGQIAYDDFGFWSAFSDADEETSAYMANVFTAPEDTCVSAVMFATAVPGDDYTIRIYGDLSDETDPTSGTLLTSVKGSAELTGYHTVALDEPVFLKAGQKFSISVHCSGESGQHLTCEAYSRMTTEHTDGTVDVNESLLAEAAILRDFHEGESFYSPDGKHWKDVFHEDAQEETETDPETGDISSFYGRMGNVCVRALTQEIGRVIFSDDTEEIPSGTQITLSCPGAEEIWYSTNGAEFGLYTQPITIDADTELSAYAVMNGTAQTMQTQRYKLRAAQLSSVLRTDTGAYLDFTDIGENCRTAICTNVGQDLTLLPITTGEITCDLAELASGERTAVPVEGESCVTLHVSEDGMQESTYVIYLTDVIRGNVNLDGAVNAVDAAEVLVYAAQKGAGAAQAQDTAWRDRADCDRDGEVNAADAAWILQTAAENGAN
ncbi:MAG: chitobiase/beta-hexosaminidase C-terminal domain-containing protein [Oscillospiraceae bacterium]|nr:chitobiase/beta-hexosaminidase C-terminal domain-containing protein [Oscillospiraceae bacterium]